MTRQSIPEGHCLICSARSEFDKELYDDRYGYPGSYRLNRCTVCGHETLDAVFESEALSSLYTEYYPRSSFDLGQYSPAKEVKGFRSWLDGDGRSAYCWVPENVRVLDIGCGFGESLGYHEGRGCDVYGVEADENIRRVADKYGFKVHVGLFDPDLYEDGFFDYVTMDQVIEHVTDPISTLEGVARVLKPGGMAILSTPNANGWGVRLFGRRWINWHAPYHLQHFSLESMTIAADRAGMVLEKARTTTSSEWLFYQWVHLLTFPCQGKPSPFWSPKGKPTLLEKLMMGLCQQVHQTKINHLATWLLDALGVGDNYLFFLRKK